MNTTSIRGKSIYKLVKILGDLESFHLDELQQTLEEIREVLKSRVRKLRIHSMVGRYFKSKSGVVIRVTGVVEDTGKILSELIKPNGRLKTTELWIGSYNRSTQEWQVIGSTGTYGIQEITESEWRQNLIYA